MFDGTAVNVGSHQLKKHKKRIISMNVKSLIALLLLSTPLTLQAHNLTTGQTLPAVSVEKHGELLLENNDIVYKPWSESQLIGKIRIVQAIAGRSSAKEMNAELMKTITASEFDQNSYQTTSVINQDDAMWGTSSFVKSSAEDSKKEFPWSSMVLDKNGSVAKSWQLSEESSTIILLDRDGVIQFVKEGALTSDEVNQVIDLIKSKL